jgi:hypothetical protein
MKSLIRKASCCASSPEATEIKPPASSAKGEQAQCCAKISKNVAGCHD